MKKLKWWQVARIKALLARCEPQEKIAAAFDVDQATVSRIATGQAWINTDQDIERPHTLLLQSPEQGENGSQRYVSRLIERWAASRAAVESQRGKALVFAYRSPDLVTSRTDEKVRVASGVKKNGKASFRNARKEVVRVWSRGDYTTHSPASSEEDRVVNAKRMRQYKKPLPSDALCWALTFEIALKSVTSLAERWELARWYKDKSGVMPFPLRAAFRLVRECRRRGLRP